MAKCCIKFLSSLALILLSGCNIIPGSHFEGLSGGQDYNNAQQELEHVNVKMIDSHLIRTQKENLQQSALATQKLPSQGVDVTGYEYKLGIGDVLSVGVWDHPELTIPAAVQRTAEFDGFRVQADGSLNFAYAPGIKAAGQTVNQVRAELVKRLSRVIEDPQVDVKVVGFKSQRTYVTGEVNKPGVYAITETPLTLIDAVSQAGGLTDNADWQQVSFTRGDVTENIALNAFYASGDISQNRLLQHGDIIHISRNDKKNVFVLGDVKRAGTVQVTRYGLNLAQALSETGGLNETTANASGVFVLRKRDFERDGVLADVYQLDAKSIAALVMAEQFELQSSDIVYVTSAPLARWNRVISLLLPSLSTVDALQDIENQ
ncbi:polysaccharide biosynthesis protein [Pseudoalteromonas sp. MSK9-3]|uniref:polysaccharide export protein n=1 Tax=Pseudoalteromonas sp. MSK9-3 TaxID=1897633 RepID=UPI000E6D58EE|nr:polysaccharide export protein [Pseudoalteromonas sp. MSK9-3]RJE75712.1 polysaccharide biosynthesis protein [Pseudoalteromonas sp. MSK9-3]